MLLPPRLQPSDVPLERRHSPRPLRGEYGYRGYRPCIRWDFGFTCAICLLHEADFVAIGIEGTGLTSIEHIEARSHDQDLVNEYSNLLYACRFCNTARSNRGRSALDGAQLLDPTEAAWENHFYIAADELRPKHGDHSAQYTADCYDIKEPRKTTLRRLRREHVQYSQRVLEAAPGRIAELNNALADDSISPSSSLYLLLKNTLDDLKVEYERIMTEILRYCAIPLDADDICRCEGEGNRALPPFIASQVWQIG